MTHDSTNLPLTAGEGEVIIACVRTAQCHHWRGEQDDGTEGAKQQNRTYVSTVRESSEDEVNDQTFLNVHRKISDVIVSTVLLLNNSLELAICS